MLSDFLAGAGVLAVAAACAGAILLPPGRLRSAVMVLAMALFPVLILGDQWHTAQIADLRHDEPRIAALLAIAALVVGLLTYVFRRWPIIFPLAVIFALPFRVPLEAGGDTANLLIPLYLVIAAGVVAAVLRDWPLPGGGDDREDSPGRESPRSETGPAGPLAIVLSAVVLLYAIQTLYSEDFSQGLQNLCFFLVPFTIAYRLLREVEWDRRLLRLALMVLAAEASLFVLIGSVEWATRSLFWNDQVIRSNEFHTYFRVNSIFWDPNVYGRYLALVTVIATAALLWARTRNVFWALAALILVLWIGLVPTYSQSSYIALLAGLAVLAAIRWGKLRWVLAAAALGCVGIAAMVLLAGGRGDAADRLNIVTGGRANLVEGGAELFSERPLRGYGSGSFPKAYKDHREDKDVPVSESHTEPVTVAAEQGLLGLLLYLSLIGMALWTLGRGIWRAPPAGGDDSEDSPDRESPESETGPAGLAARAAILAAFIALLVHTLSYAGFFDDPITWVLLAIGASLAYAEPAAVRDPA